MIVSEPGRRAILLTAPTVIQPELSAGQQGVVRTLLYYHIFDFPLSAGEIFRFSPVVWRDAAELEGALHEMVAAKLIGIDRGFHFIGEDSHVDERRADEARARAALPRAARWSRFISRFPHVRGVAISGTLSKGVMKEGDDLDYLVFTEPERVWFCRLLLMGFKKVFLFNSHHCFCVNYLLAEDHLEVPDRDLFTAMEIAWLLPTVNPTIHDRFLDANSWIMEYLPNWRRCVREVAPISQGLVKTVAETCAGGARGRRLDDWSHRIISRRNQRRYRHLEIRHEVAMRSEKHASKHHPRAFRERVLRRLAHEIVSFEERHGVAIGGGEAAAP